MEAENSLLRHIPIRRILRFGHTCSDKWAVPKYVFSFLSWQLLVKCYTGFQQHTRDQIPAWGGLLIVYATIFVPVFFSLLVTINILVWTKVRINHVFIFGEYIAPYLTTKAPTPRAAGLNDKSKIDYRQYVEVRRLLVW